MDLMLQGKRALITGSTRGLGLATARVLASEGARVAINGRSGETLARAAAELVRDFGSPVAAIRGDMADPRSSERIVQEAVSELGGLDILITNSGGPPVGKFESFDDEAWRHAVELAFLGHVRLIRAALPPLEVSKAASVLTVTSYSVKHPLDNLILSNSIRAATVALTKSLAIELGVKGIRFNSILPGWTETERVRQIMRSRAEINRTNPEEEYQKVTDGIPLRRMAQPSEFAKAAAFLVSPAASFINGVMLQVDGGATRGLL